MQLLLHNVGIISWPHCSAQQANSATSLVTVPLLLLRSWLRRM
jgi:hypothetical protein